LVPVARRNLLAEKGRLAMSIGGVAFAVVLVLVILGLYRGWSGATALFEELPGDLWVAEEGTRDPFRSSSHLPETSAAELAALPGVAATIPVYGRRVAFSVNDAAADVFFFAFDVPTTLPLAEEAREAFVPAAGDVVIDSAVARDADLEPGDPIAVLGRRLTVTAIRPGGNPIFEVGFLSGPDGRALLALPDYVNYVVLVAEPGADLDAIEAAVGDAMSGVVVRTGAEFAESMGDLVDQGFLPVVGVLVGIGLVVGGAVIGVTVYTATIERSRDFGVLKAVGASSAFLYRIVVTQSLIVGSLGGALGVGAAALAATVIARDVPQFVTELRPLDAVVVLAAAIAVSLVAAWVPVRRINRIDPAIVFRA
jgi:putative ABC transport system permease protein